MELIWSKIYNPLRKVRVMSLGQREHNNNSSNEQPYVLITTGSHDVLKFDQTKSVSLCVGIDKQFHRGYKDKSLGNIVAKDAETTSEAITNHLGLNQDQVKLRTASAQPYDCTKRGMGTLFVEIAGKVQEGGIFIFYFAGHGILVRERCVLAPADFAGRENLDSGISGKDLVGWLHEAGCRADHVLVILDCCYAGDLGTILTAPDNMLRIKPSLFVMSGCAAREKCSSVNALGHSIFTYFFLHYLERHPCKGQFPIKEAMEDINELCLSFSSLVVGHDEEHLRPRKMSPNLEKLDVSVDDVDVSIDEPDASRFGFVIQLLEQGHPKPVPHLEVEKWLKSPTIQDALSTLYAKVTIPDHEELQEGIFCAMLYSAASIQYVHDKTHLEERNLFLTTVISVLGAIGFAYPEVNATIFHLITGLQHYSEAAIVGKMSKDSLNNLFSEMITEATKGYHDSTVAANYTVAENGNDEVDFFPVLRTTTTKVYINSYIAKSIIL